MRAGLLLLVVLCGGCSLFQSAPDAAPTGDPSTLRCWHLEGKIAVRDEHDSGSAYVHWQQRDNRFHLRISGPLGAGAAVAYGDDETVVMRLADDHVMIGRTAEALVARHFGWRVPFASLDWWARGLETPGSAAAITRDETGLAREIHQDGWQILLQDYDEYDGYRLPVRIELNQPPRRVRVRIRDWQPGNCRIDT